MRYVLALLLILGTCGVCEAGCENGHCKTPVRTAILKTAKATAKVATAPFRCRCRRGCCK
jgi:hypothetical protein